MVASAACLAMQSGADQGAVVVSHANYLGSMLVQFYGSQSRLPRRHGRDYLPWAASDQLEGNPHDFLHARHSCETHILQYYLFVQYFLHRAALQLLLYAEVWCGVQGSNTNRSLS